MTRAIFNQQFSNAVFLSYAIKIFTIAATIREIIVVVVMEPRISLCTFAVCRFTPFISRNLSCGVLCLSLFFCIYTLLLLPSSILVLLPIKQKMPETAQISESCSTKSLRVSSYKLPHGSGIVMSTGPDASIFIS